MNLETKIIHFDHEEYACFGWKLDEKAEAKNTFVRDTSMKAYDDIVKLEAEYEELKVRHKVYTPTHPARVICAFLCFIIPGILYVKNKNKQKKKVNEFNDSLDKKIENVLEAAKALL